MADHRKMIPFILYCEAGLKPEQVSPDRRTVDIYVDARKRGYANDPKDSGGPTMCGVTLTTYRAYRKTQGYQYTTVDDLKQMSFLAWTAIFKSMYWDRCRADQIEHQMTAVAIVDWVWGSGPKAIKKIQRVLRVKEDGIVGKITLDAINSAADKKALFDAIQQARNAYHESIAKPGSKNAVFLRGWNRRVSMITFDGFNYR